MTALSSDPATILPALHALLAPIPGVRLALLFGSVARGEAAETSDVDLAFDVEPPADLMNIAAKVSSAIGREAHVIALRDVGVPLLEELVRDSIVVHEGVLHAAARWRSSALLALEIDRPWYARMREGWLRHVAQHGLRDGQP